MAGPRSPRQFRHRFCLFDFRGRPFSRVFTADLPPRAEDIISNTGGVVELDPERSWNYEAAYAPTPIRGLQLEGTFFRLDYENQIVPASIAGGIGAALTNGGETLQQGMEFSGRLDSDASSPRGTTSLSAPLSLAADRRISRHAAQLDNELRHPEFVLPARGGSARRSARSPATGFPYTPETTATTSLGYSHAKGFQAFVENVYISDHLRR